MSFSSQVSALAGAIRDKLNTITPRLIPAGGTTGQVLSKSDSADYAFGWTDSLGGGGGDDGTSDPLDLTVTAPGTPPAGTVRLFRQDIAGRPYPAFVSSSGLSTAVQTLIAQNKISWFNPPGNVNTSQVIGMNITGTGTALTASVSQDNVHTASRRLEYGALSASTLAVSGIRSATLQFWLGSVGSPLGGFTFVTRFGPARGQACNATRVFFAGMTSNISQPQEVVPPSDPTWANMIGAGCDSGDVNWHIMHRNGTGTRTKIDTGIPKSYDDDSEMFELSLFSAPNSPVAVGVRFTRLSDNLVFTHTITDNLPPPTQLLTWQIWNSCGGTNSVIGIAISSVYIETAY